jgi:hypothetical protein
MQKYLFNIAANFSVFKEVVVEAIVKICLLFAQLFPGKVVHKGRHFSVIACASAGYRRGPQECATKKQRQVCVHYCQCA